MEDSLFECGAVPDADWKNGHAALVFAACVTLALCLHGTTGEPEERLAVVTLLIGTGADVNACDSECHTPFHNMTKHFGCSPHEVA